MGILLFAGGMLFLGYAVAGYPLLLGLLARLFRREVRKEFLPLTVSVIVAVYNGERFLRAKLESILALDYPSELMEIIIVDDGSSDGTSAIAREFESHGVQLVIQPQKSGKAAALNAGMLRAKNEILLFTDVRQPFDPAALRYLVACFADPAVGSASGLLVIRKGETREESDVGMYWRYETWIRDRLSAIDSIFGATGSIYAMRRSLAEQLRPETLLDDVCLPMNAFFKGYRLIVENRAKVYDYPTALDSEFRRKVRTLAGNVQLIQMYPALLGPRNRLWFHFVSYKLTRLLMPHAMILVFASSFFLPWPLALVALAAQGLFYGAALADKAIPQSFPGKRITSICRTVVVMMSAAFCAAAVLFVPAQKLWKDTRVRPATQ